jgi:ABC-type transport system involved in multi-copper enzyme maturation permease subunit
MSLKVSTWQEAIAGILWLAAAAALVWLGEPLPLWERTILWAVLTLGLGIILRRFWAWLLGPLFFYDLVRTARRNRLIPVRTLYGIALFLLVFLFYVRWFNFRPDSWEELFSTRSLQRDRLAAFGWSTFSLFFAMQYLAVFLITPIYTAGTIAEERERRTLDLLLTTRLTNREIVMGLLASRLATLGLVFLTSLPVLSLMEFLGGIDPEQVVAGYLGTLTALVNIGSICMMVSVFARNATHAFLEGYAVVASLAGCWLGAPLGFLFAPRPGELLTLSAYVALAGGGPSAVFVLIAMLQLRKARQGPEPIPTPRSMRREGLPTDAIAVGYKEVYPVYDSALATKRPPVCDPPILWKEFYSQKLPTAFAVYLFFYFCFFGCMPITLLGPAFEQPSFREFSSLAILFLVIPVGLLASRMITKERQGRTLDSLLTTFLDTKDIFRSKWLACILRLRWAFVYPTSLLLIALAREAIHPLAFLSLMLAFLVYAAFVTCLGLFISTLCETGLKATLIMILVFLAMGMASQFGVGRDYGHPSTVWRWISHVLIYTASPIDSLYELTFGSRALSRTPGEISAAASAVLLVAIATWGLWKLTLISFERVTKGPRR